MTDHSLGSVGDGSDGAEWRRHPLGDEVQDLEANEATQLRRMADLLWDSVHGAPPLQQDPVAAMLGLVPDSNLALDASKLIRICKRARLEPSSLAARLSARGWQVQPRDVFRWQTGSTSDVSPALIAAIADEAGVQIEELTARDAAEPARSALAGLVKSSAFQALVARWARVQGVSIALANSQLESRMMATVYRGDRVDPDQMLDSLEALVRARETAKSARDDD